MSYQTKWYDSRVEWVLGDGNQVRLWEDIWVYSQTLKEKFPRLFSLSMCKDIVISDVGDWVHIVSGATFRWNLTWRRRMFEWKKKIYNHLLLLLNSVQWRRGEVDSWIWEDDDSFK